MRLGLAPLLTLLTLGPAAAWLAVSGPIAAQDGARSATAFETAGQARSALDRARRQAREARRRAGDFDRRATTATAASDRAQAEAAALAARVQQAEAAIGIAEAQLALVAAEKRRLDLRLARRRQPIVELTGALQTLVRRPLSLSLLTPHSLRETVYLGAVLDSTVPLIRARTADLRGDLDRSLALQGEARAALGLQRTNEKRLTQRRADLAALATRQRQAARRASGAADREDLRALALAEQARDLDGLVDRLDELGSLRERLAALPGPIPRPADPGAGRARAQPSSGTPAPAPSARPSAMASAGPPRGYRLPVDGRLVGGFGAGSVGSGLGSGPGNDPDGAAGGARGQGLSLVPRGGAQVVAPGPGRVAFAGPYRGYGRIVIVEHSGGWTSLVTGLASLDTRVGSMLVPGSPLGRAAARDPLVVLELRRRGMPVNPLDYLR